VARVATPPAFRPRGDAKESLGDSWSSWARGGGLHYPTRLCQGESEGEELNAHRLWTQDRGAQSR
jgi:hypothetical protein